jgi:uncharacterized protein (DUF1810 family)
MTRLDRFRAAQNSSSAGFDAALRELRSGGKQGHWVWYIFPQLAGLGSSAAARMYAIADEAEAVEFLREAELRSRLLTITTVVAEQLRGGHVGLRVLMGSDLDAKKLVSSLTLFAPVARRLSGEHDDCRRLADVAGEVLSLAAREGYPACAFTRQRLR